ncbi:MAG: TRAP transporter substrate-binding protein DctP [Desulfovermiculus sp.]|nr:TRAP transporter substrate-binding protein DctP [Desulfovermiculus sp.]
MLTNRFLLALGVCVVFLFTVILPFNSHAKSNEVIELTLSTYLPPSYEDLVVPIQKFVDRVNEKGKGLVQIDFYHSGTLLKANESIAGLRRGVADIVAMTSSYWTGSISIYNGYSLPFLWEDAYDMQKKVSIGTPLREFMNDQLQKDGFHLLAEGAIPVEHLWMAKGKDPVRNPEDLQGKKIRVSGKAQSRTIQALGGSPVRMPSGEVHEALSRGIVDGAQFYMGTVGGRALYETLGSCLKATMGGYTEPLIMMQSKWEELPEKVQDLLFEQAKWYEDFYAGWSTKVHEEQYWPKFEEEGETVTLSPEQEDKFREATQPVYDWFTEEECPEVGDRFLELVRGQ